MENNLDKAFNAMSKINTYCCRILDRPVGTHCADAVVMAEVISSYVQEGLRAIENEQGNNRRG